MLQINSITGREQTIRLAIGSKVVRRGSDPLSGPFLIFLTKFSKPYLVFVGVIRPQFYWGSPKRWCEKMASESSVMAVIRASRPSFRNPHDKVAFAVHASFLAAGFSLIATGTGALSENLPIGACFLIFWPCFFLLRIKTRFLVQICSCFLLFNVSFCLVRNKRSCF